MQNYNSIKLKLKTNPKTWLITGVAGFIGSNLLESLLKLNQFVIGIDDFSLGLQKNLDEVKSLVASEQWDNFEFKQADIRNFEDCKRVCMGVDYVLHQAALGSVPRSIEDPISTNSANIDGFLNILVAAKDANVKRLVYASSSSTYGDNLILPKKETDTVGLPLSPYALTKYTNELYAIVFAKTYGFKTIGLRYFNVFGPRQDPNGAYAAVIPKWFSQIINNERVHINGDGKTSRDFTFVANAVQINILSATSENDNAVNQIYNVAVGQRTTLNELYKFILDNLIRGKHANNYQSNVVYDDFRIGDVRHSLADISKAKDLLGYNPTHNIDDGIKESMGWYVKQHGFQ